MPTRELQLNDWTIDVLRSEVKELGFQPIRNRNHSYSLFSTSRPDFVCVRRSDDHCKVYGVALMEQEQCIDVTDLFGATIEFKIEGSPYNYPQVFANMIKLVSDMLVDALTRGGLVDLVTVYGLLVSYNDRTDCVLMKYTCDFRDNNYLITVGEEQNFCELLSSIVLIGCKCMA